jgi:hypothetical protein
LQYNGYLTPVWLFFDETDMHQFAQVALSATNMPSVEEIQGPNCASSQTTSMDFDGFMPQKRREPKCKNERTERWQTLLTQLSIDDGCAEN